MPTSTRPVSPARPVLVESLEHRQLLSAAPPLPPSPITTWLTGTGTLVISGTPGNDTFVVRRLGKSYQVVDDGYAPLLVSGAGAKRISILGGAGKDRMAVDSSVTLRCTLAGGGGNDVLDGNAGDNLVGGHGNDKLCVASVRPFRRGTLLAYPPSRNGASVLTGGAGRDTLVAGGTDTVVGGTGHDMAFYHRFVLDGQPMTPDDPAGMGQHMFGVRSSGTESFRLLTESLKGEMVASG
jgi:hypothetical protein